MVTGLAGPFENRLYCRMSPVLSCEWSGRLKVFCASFFESVKDLDLLLCLKIMPYPIACHQSWPDRFPACRPSLYLPPGWKTPTRIALIVGVSWCRLSSHQSSKKGASLSSVQYVLPPLLWQTHGTPDCSGLSWIVSAMRWQSRYVNECDLSYRYAFWLV